MRQKSPRDAGVFAESPLLAKTWNWMVVDAVTSEPVSLVRFPANREKNREFHQIRALGAILKADTRANSEACREIPYSAEQGIFAKDREFVQENREFCTREQGS